MSRENRLRRILRHSGVWRSVRDTRPLDEHLATGYPALDRLCGGGWPLGVLIELLYSGEGQGELQLCLPALLAVTGKQQAAGSAAQRLAGRPICWIAPPCLPYAPALLQAGLDLSQLLVVRANTSRDTLWAIEQVLRAGVCAVVLAWLPQAGGRTLRRLQLAAATARSCTLLFRPLSCLQVPSPAPLRIRLQACAGGLALEITRNRYGPTDSLVLPC